MKSISEHMKSKKGIGLNDAFGATLTLVLVAVLLIISLVLFDNLKDTFTASSTEANATDDMITAFVGYIPLVTLVGTIIFLAIVIGVLVNSFMFNRGARNL